MRYVVRTAYEWLSRFPGVVDTRDLTNVDMRRWLTVPEFSDIPLAQFPPLLCMGIPVVAAVRSLAHLSTIPDTAHLSLA